MDPFAALMLTSILAGAGRAPSVGAQAFTGDLSQQKFVQLRADLHRSAKKGAAAVWQGDLRTEDGRAVKVSFEATCVDAKGTQSWAYRIRNDEPGLTVCKVTFPTVDGVRIGSSWKGNRVVWPGLYRGALIDDLSTQESFEKQAKAACKDVPYLYGQYQGDLCLPYFVHEGPGEAFSMTVLDPTHEVVMLTGQRHEDGMTYAVSTSPKVPTGKSWSFGSVEVSRAPGRDWHATADRYRSWLEKQGFGGNVPRHREVATIMYHRWDDLRSDEIISWAKALGIKDVLIWVNLYGRGDQYYPCYFPNPKTTGYDGMKRELGRLNAAGLAPYFYTNGYLLSPFQTREDVIEWNKRFPKDYPWEIAQGDTGYASTVAEFRAQGHDFAGDWLQTPHGIDPLRVRRVDFTWGEYPIYFWHGRPFYSACVNSAEWRKLFRDTARMHAELGAKGIYIDQPGAIAPEICAALGHGHDTDSFGMWNRAYLELMKEIKETGNAIAPGFFLEIEGSSDLYGKYVDRSLGNFNQVLPERSYSRMLRYTAPWILTDIGIPSLSDPAAMEKHIEDSLLLGAIFRTTTNDDPSLMTSPAARLLKAGIAARRRLAPYIDGARFMDDTGLTTTNCEATWFDSPKGLLIAVRASADGASVRLNAKPGPALSRVTDVDWHTGSSKAADMSKLTKGFHLIVVQK